MQPAIAVALLAALPSATPAAPSRIANLLGVPYVEDACRDARGRWITFAQPERVRTAPGLNCSAFVVEAARLLLGFAGSPAEAARDRLGDSGPGAKAGRDWDFGWDLVLNLSEGRPRRWLAGDGTSRAPGIPAHDLPSLFPELRRDRVYLADFLRTRGKGLPPAHHHVGVLLPVDGSVWFYQTLPKGRVHRLDLASPQGIARFRAMFGPAERVRVLEVEPLAER